MLWAISDTGDPSGTPKRVKNGPKWSKMTFFTTPTWEPRKSRCALKYTQKESKIKSTKYNFSYAHLVVALKILLDNLFADDWYVDHLNELNIAQNKHEIEKKILTNT